MKRSIKAVLLSALVFPGAGYFSVNKTKRGLTFLLLSGGALGAIVYDLTYKAQSISAKIMSGELSVNSAALQQEIINTPGPFAEPIISLITFGLGLLWLIGVFDSYRLGKQFDH